MADKDETAPITDAMRFLPAAAERDQPQYHATPSFFCRLVGEVVYWKVRF